MIDALIKFFVTGGWVMYPLLAMSILAVTLIIERLVFWFSTPRRSGPRRLQQYAQAFASGDLEHARSASSKDNSLEGAVVLATLTSGAPSESRALATIESLRASIDRFSTVLATIIAAAPLLGILGTVTGIIQSFDLLGEASAVNNPAAVAGGIAEALYTTAFGLTVALVAIFPHVFFRAKAEQALSRLETLAAMLGELGSKSDGQ